MNDALMYFLKVNIAISLFYIFYRLVFYNDTFWATRRFYLVVSMLLSVIYPFISFSGWLEKQEPMKVIMANYVQLKEITVTNAPATFLTFENILLAMYGLVSLILLIKMFVQLTSILRWRLKGKRQDLQGIEIIAVDATITPFSFFNTIFINPGLHNEQETHQILTHECTHARQLHSLDVLLSELMTVLFWINPAAWLLKREIRHNLEFLADNSVLKSGIDSKNYQYHLLQLSYQVPENQLINKFNISPLKKRITMMNQQKTKKAGILKYALIVPLALALVLSSNAETIVNSTKKALASTKETLADIRNQNINSQKENKTQLTSTVKDTTQIKLQEEQQSEIEKTYTVVEKMPQFHGGEEALINYISQNIKYPREAIEKGVHGTILIRFIVNSKGKVVDPIFLKSTVSEDKKDKNENLEVVELLNHEALRVINSLPDFIPGEQNGKKVSVYYTLPIVFSLVDAFSSSSHVQNPNVGVEYGDKDFKNSGVPPQVKQSDPKNPPLYIVDGKEVLESYIKAIKPEDIKEISVLKNSSATSIYGDKGKNGVILITMKKLNLIKAEIK